MTRIERVSRALCRFQGLPEDTKYNGCPMWESFVYQAVAILEAADEAPQREHAKGKWQH